MVQKISRPYTEMMQQRVEYRKKLLAYLNDGAQEGEDPKVGQERRARRYRRYVQHGIGTEHIAPLQQSFINCILNLIPFRFLYTLYSYLEILFARHHFLSLYVLSIKYIFYYKIT
jgi:hypothetical protein